MKLTLCLSASLFALLALPAGLHAALPNEPVNPYANVDPDGVPLAVTQGTTSAKPTPAQQAELLQKQQEQETRSRNWLLLDYERQFKSSPQNATLNRTLNMYLQLSMNRDLSAVANDANASSNASTEHTPAPALHATPKGASVQNSMSLRPDATPGKLTFAPLISPFNSSYASSASQPFGTSAYSTKLPSSLAPGGVLNAPPAAAPAPAPAPHRSLSDLPASPAETIDMQTPGMIADKSNPLPGMPNLNLDSLPDPSATSSQEQPELPQIREPVDADLLHQEMTVKAAPAKPGVLGKKETPAPVAPPAPPPPEEPMPISKQPQLSPVHAPVANPFDMLNH